MLRSRPVALNFGVRIHHHLDSAESAHVRMRLPRRKTWRGKLAVFGFVILAAVADAPATAACPESASRSRDGGVRWLRNEVSQVDGEAEYRLLADLVTVREAFGDHHEPVRFARDLAAAFRRYGFDLDKVDPKIAGERLGNRASTGQIAAEIDNWSFMRRIRVERLECRALGEVARAIDADPWRNSMRDQIDRREADALSVLRRCAADAGALEKQPVQSLLLLAVLLGDIGERAGAESVMSVAARRFPENYWIWHARGCFYQSGSVNADAGKAVEAFAKAASLRPKSAFARGFLGEELQCQKNFDRAIVEYREAILLKPDFADARLQLGYLLWRQGKAVDAISECRECSASSQTLPKPTARLAACLAYKGKPTKRLPNCAAPSN